MSTIMLRFLQAMEIVSSVPLAEIEQVATLEKFRRALVAPRRTTLAPLVSPLSRRPASAAAVALERLDRLDRPVKMGYLVDSVFLL